MLFIQRNARGKTNFIQSVTCDLALKIGKGIHTQLKEIWEITMYFYSTIITRSAC